MVKRKAWEPSAQLMPGEAESGEVPSRQLKLLETEPLDEAQCKKYRSAVGSAIYLSLDRRDTQFAVKEECQTQEV